MTRHNDEGRKSDDGTLKCDVKGCYSDAIARVYPTSGRTDHEALRCRDCLEGDLDTNHFAEWRVAIHRKEETWDQ